MSKFVFHICMIIMFMVKHHSFSKSSGLILTTAVEMKSPWTYV